jgi:hypothetical protein
MLLVLGLWGFPIHFGHAGCVPCGWWLAGVVSTSFFGVTVPSLDSQGENQMSDLHWLCLTIYLVKALFWELRVSPGWKTEILDQATTVLVHCFLLEASLLDRATRSWPLWRGLFSLIIFYFCLCVSIISFGHLVGAEAWCNWYLCDINIFLFSKKVEVSVIPIFTKRRAMILRKWTREEEMSSYL